MKEGITILEEGSHPHLRCTLCHMFVPRPAGHCTHPNTAMCRVGVGRKWRKETLERTQRAGEEAIMVRGEGTTT